MAGQANWAQSEPNAFADIQSIPLREDAAAGQASTGECSRPASRANCSLMRQVASSIAFGSIFQVPELPSSSFRSLTPICFISESVRKAPLM